MCLIHPAVSPSPPSNGALPPRLDRRCEEPAQGLPWLDVPLELFQDFNILATVEQPPSYLRGAISSGSKDYPLDDCQVASTDDRG